jgi:hypothetical protein
VRAQHSATIRSPYVADVRLADGSIAMAHAPGMEMGGQCIAGASVLLSRNTSGTTKTAYAIQLVAADEPECGACRPTWVGAHPALANRLVAAALARGLLVPALGVHDAVCAEVKLGHMRVDFQLTHAAVAGAAHTTTLLEVKTVGCADYAFGSAAPHPKGYDLVYGLPGVKYTRAAVFPVGKQYVRGRVAALPSVCACVLCVVCSDKRIASGVQEAEAGGGHAGGVHARHQAHEHTGGARRARRHQGARRSAAAPLHHESVCALLFAH